MKIININKKVSSQLLIPHINVSNEILDMVVDKITELIHLEMDNYVGDDLDTNMRLFIKTGIKKAQDTLMVKRLLKEHKIDKYFFEMAENIYCSALENE